MNDDKTEANEFALDLEIYEDLPSELESHTGLWMQTISETIAALNETRLKAMENITTALSLIDSNLNGLMASHHKALTELQEVSEQRELYLEALARQLRDEVYKGK